jgi:uncharacterized protein
MSSNPSQPAPGWPPSGPASPEPLNAVPDAGDGFTAAGQSVHTGPHDHWSAGPEGSWQAGQGRWPTARAPWPGQAAGPQTSGPGHGPAEQTWVVTEERAAPVADGAPQNAAHAPEPDEERLAMLCYVGVPFLGPLVPLAVYLIRKHSSGFVRFHSAQALSLSITALLYTICVLILGGMLALDSLNLALIIAVPVAALLWLTILGFVVRAASRVYRGSYYRIPSWLCATIVH